MSTFKKIYTELVEAMYTKQRKTNDLPPPSSNWYKVAKAFDVGVLDLDNIAVAAEFANFEDLDRLTPKEISRSPVFPEIVDAFKKYAVSASDMSDSQIEKIIEKG